MNNILAILSVVALVQTGPGEQASATHGTAMHGTAIHEGLPAQVVADLVQKALYSPEDSETWAALEGAVISDVAGSSAGPYPVLDIAMGALGNGATLVSRWAGVASDRAVNLVQWSLQSSQGNPLIWVGGLALFVAALLGIRTGRGPRRRGLARRAPARGARTVAWKPRKRTPVFGRRVGLPKAGRLLGQGLPAYEVSRQTGLSRDILSLVDFRNTGPSEVSRSGVSADLLIARPRQGGTSAPGSFTRADSGTGTEYPTSTISITA